MTYDEKAYEKGLWREWHNVGEEHTTDFFRIVADGEVKQAGTRYVAE